MLCRLHTAIMESYTNAVMPLLYSIPLVPTSSVKFLRIFTFTFA